MFTNVKSQIGGIGGWIGSNIPKFRKGEGETEQGEQQEQQPLTEETETTGVVVSEKKPRDDDDNSRYLSRKKILIFTYMPFNF